VSEKTLEHIWPQALGGNASPPLFQSNNVCKICNSLSGLWIDGAFIKSCFTSFESAAAARVYFDPQKPGTAPLTYLGVDQEFPNQPNQICERWLGQAGEQIYHVHLDDDDKWYGFAGGDIIKRKNSDAGYACVSLSSQSTYWSLTALHSFAAKFKGARLFSLTHIEGLPAELASMFVDEKGANPEETAAIAWMKARPQGVMQKLRLSIRLDFSDRFLAKLCLGIGSNLFGTDYTSSPYADELRKLLWQKNPTEQDKPKIFGANYFQETNFPKISGHVGCSGAWSILLVSMSQGFGLHVCTPSGRGMTMCIAIDNALWSSQTFEQFRNGAIYYVVPERQLFVGPVSLLHRIAHQNGSFVEPQLAKLEALKCDPASLPKAR